MTAKSSSFEKFDSLLMGNISVATALVVAALVLWAAALVLFQCLSWLTAGQWQPIPAYAVFMTQTAQDYSLKMYEAKMQPLDMVPALGESEDLEQVAKMIAGNMLGLRKVASWLLSLPLALWLLGGAFLSLIVQTWAHESRMQNSP